MVFPLFTHDIHLWTEELALSSTQEQERLELLSVDEQARAARFHFPIHRQSYIAARSALRKILSLYLNISPQQIVFAYDVNKKPYLPSAPHLQFNVSHSKQMAIYAITLNYFIGVDIEKIKKNYNSAIAKRFFSAEENEELLTLSSEKQISAFYQIWAHKEAFIKASPQNFSMPTTAFSISLNLSHQVIHIANEDWSFVHLPVTDYQAALVTNQKILNIYSWKYFDHSPQLIQSLSIS